MAAHNREVWQKAAPDGFEAVVRVTVAGMDPFVVGRVETSDDPFVFLHEASETDFERTTKDDRMVMTRQEHVIATEILYLRVKGESRRELVSEWRALEGDPDGRMYKLAKRWGLNRANVHRQLKEAEAEGLIEPGERPRRPQSK